MLSKLFSNRATPPAKQKTMKRNTAPKMGSMK